MAALIEAMGGQTVVSKELELPHSTVKSWPRRESIPPEHWEDVIALARKNGIDGVNGDYLLVLHRPLFRQWLAKSDRGATQPASEAA